jgi:MFS transporter, DHA1 family, inner membrane transport protein
MNLDNINIKNEKLYIFILATIQFAHMVDFVIMMPLGPVMMKQFLITPAKFGLLVSSYNYSAGICAIFFAIIADKFNRKTLLILSKIGFILGTIFCGLSQSYSTLLISRIITGAFGGVLNALILTIITDLVPFQRRGKAMSVIISSFSFASVIGVPLGLAIADYFHWKYTFYFISFFSTIILFFAFRVLPDLSFKIVDSNAFYILKKYLKVLSNIKYLKAYLLMLCMSLTMFMLIPYLAPYAVKNIGIKTYELKYMYFFGGLATIFTARLFGKLTDKLGSLKVYITLSLISCVPIILYTNAGVMNLFYYILLGTLFMTIISGRMIPAMTLVSAIPKDQDRGSFMSLLYSVRSIGTATATLIGGMMIIDHTDRLENFNHVGWTSIVLIILSLFLAKIIYNIISIKK